MTPSSAPGPGLVLRPASAADADALTALERAAGLAGLGHLFPVEEHPYPTAAVARRWRATLADPAVRTVVAEGGDGLVALVAHDATTVRHLAVDPDHWGRGAARTLLADAVASIRAGAQAPRLWCLVGNARARALYDGLGWRPSGLSRPTAWPPHPVEVELVLATRTP